MAKYPVYKQSESVDAGPRTVAPRASLKSPPVSDWPGCTRTVAATPSGWPILSCVMAHQTSLACTTWTSTTRRSSYSRTRLHVVGQHSRRLALGRPATLSCRELARMHPTGHGHGRQQPVMYSRPSTAVPPLPILSQPRVLHPNALTPMTMRPEIGGSVPLFCWHFIMHFYYHRMRVCSVSAGGLMFVSCLSPF